MKRKHRQILLAVIAIILLVFGVMLWLGSLGYVRGVREVQLPRASLMRTTMPEPDYLDSYRAPLPTGQRTFTGLDDLRAAAFEKGEEIARSRWEVVYAGRSPGLDYQVSYILEGGEPTGLRVSTGIEYRNWIGRVYFAIIRPFHRQLTPFMVSRMARWRAKPAAAE